MIADPLFLMRYSLNSALKGIVLSIDRLDTVRYLVDI
jgi:hypothetical protein